MDDVNSDSGPLQAASALPTTLVDGRYRVRRRLAKGGMADVYLAEDTVLHRDVALKVLFSVYAADPTFVSRFRREATSAARLSHPNIVQVFDWASHDDTYYIAMEHVDGGSLADRLNDDQPLDLDRLIEIGAATAAALGYAHDRGTVHRDVKPGNILITAAGIPKVADFGIASAAEGNDNLTETGTVLGTLNYMSPEQAAGERAGPPSDLYSLGVVLFEMATGDVPFSAPTAVGLAHRLINEQAPRPSSIEPSIPAALDSLIVRLLAKEPTDRPLTAHQVEDALRAVAVDQRPMPPSPEVNAARPLEPTRIMAPPVFADVNERREMAEPEPAGPTGRPGWLIFALALVLVAAVGGLIFLSGFVDSSGADPAVSTTSEQPGSSNPSPTTGQSSTTVESTTTVTEAESTTDTPPATTAAPPQTQPPSTTTAPPTTTATSPPEASSTTTG